MTRQPQGRPPRSHLVRSAGFTQSRTCPPRRPPSSRRRTAGLFKTRVAAPRQDSDALGRALGKKTVALARGRLPPLQSLPEKHAGLAASPFLGFAPQALANVHSAAPETPDYVDELSAEAQLPHGLDRADSLGFIDSAVSAALHRAAGSLYSQLGATDEASLGRGRCGVFLIERRAASNLARSWQPLDARRGMPPLDARRGLSAQATRRCSSRGACWAARRCTRPRRASRLPRARRRR